MENRKLGMLFVMFGLLVASTASAQTLSIDLDLGTAGIQSSLDKSTLQAGGTVSGALYMEGTAQITNVVGFDQKVLVSPASAMDTGSDTDGSYGMDKTDDVQGYFRRQWMNLDPGTSITLPDNIFTFDLVLPDPIPEGDITFSIADVNIGYEFGSPPLSIGDVTVNPAAIVSAVTPTDTPTDTPTLAETPTDTPTFTFTPTDTPTISETPTDTPTHTPTSIITDTPTDTPTETEDMGYVLLDGYGAHHLQGTAVALMPDFNNENELFPWYGINIARDIEFLSDNTTRLLLSGYGQVATVVKGATTTYDNSLLDIQDDKYVSVKPSSSGGCYVLDKYGEVTILGSANNALAGVITGSLLPGGRVGEVTDTELLLRAVDLEVNADEDTVYVLDSFGGVHIQGADAAERGALSRTYFGWDIARDLEFFSANEYDCVLDGLGGIHPVSGESLPDEFAGSIPGTVAMSYHYFGWDIARDVEFTPDFKAAWKLDGYGVAHNCGLAPIVPGLWFGWDIAMDLEIYLGETQF